MCAAKGREVGRGAPWDAEEEMMMWVLEDFEGGRKKGRGKGGKAPMELSWGSGGEGEAWRFASEGGRGVGCYGLVPFRAGRMKD